MGRYSRFYSIRVGTYFGHLAGNSRLYPMICAQTPTPPSLLLMKCVFVVAQLLFYRGRFLQLKNFTTITVFLLFQCWKVEKSSFLHKEESRKFNILWTDTKRRCCWIDFWLNSWRLLLCWEFFWLPYSIFIQKEMATEAELRGSGHRYRLRQEKFPSGSVEFFEWVQYEVKRLLLLQVDRFLLYSTVAFLITFHASLWCRLTRANTTGLLGTSSVELARITPRYCLLMHEPFINNVILSCIKFCRMN